MKITVKGMTKAKLRVDALDISRTDMNVLMRQLGQQTVIQTHKHFEGGYGPDGTWAKLSPATIAINPKRKTGDPLTDTGTLQMAVTVIKASHTQVRIGVRGLKYARFHQFGVRSFKMFGREKSKATLPQRKFLGWNAEEIKELERLVESFITMRGRA